MKGSVGYSWRRARGPRLPPPPRAAPRVPPASPARSPPPGDPNPTLTAAAVPASSSIRRQDGARAGSAPRPRERACPAGRGRDLGGGARGASAGKLKKNQCEKLGSLGVSSARTSRDPKHTLNLCCTALGKEHSYRGGSSPAEERSGHQRSPASKDGKDMALRRWQRWRC